MKISSAPAHSRSVGAADEALVSEDEIRRLMSRYKADEGLGQAVSSRQPRPALRLPDAEPAPTGGTLWQALLGSGLGRLVDRLR